MTLFLLLLGFVIVAAGLALYFVKTDHGEKEPIGALWIAFGFGALAALAAGLLESWLLPSPQQAVTKSLANLLVVAMAIGLIEELVKFVPFALFIRSKRYFNENTDGIIYFALVGLGFGLPENILYTMQYGVSTGVGRLIITPLFHAAITGFVGYFFVRYKLGGGSLLKVVGALAAAIVLHGIYDFGLTSNILVYTVISLAIAFGLTVALFGLYWHARDLDERAGLSSVGRNNYCRSCGQRNAKHNLYCTQCGQRA